MAYVRPTALDDPKWALRATSPPTTPIDLGLTERVQIAFTVYDDRTGAVGPETLYPSVQTPGSGGPVQSHFGVVTNGVASAGEGGNPGTSGDWWYQFCGLVGSGAAFEVPDAEATTGGGYLFPVGSLFSFPEIVDATGTVVVMEVFELVTVTAAPSVSGSGIMMVV